MLKEQGTFWCNDSIAIVIRHRDDLCCDELRLRKSGDDGGRRTYFLWSNS